MKPVKLAFLILTTILIGYVILYFYSLSKIEVRSMEIKDLQDVSLKGFNLGGNIELYNGGVMEVSIDHLEYTVVLESSGSEISKGYIEGAKIPAKQSVTFPISSEIYWVPTAELALNLITSKNTYAKIKGDAYVNLKIYPVKVPFEKRIDLEPYIKQFVKNKIEQAVNNLKDELANTISSLEEKIKSFTGNFLS